MTLRVRINGIDYENAKSIRAERSMRSLCGSFEIESSADEQENLPLSVGDRVEVVTDSAAVFITGFVEGLEVIQDASTHGILASGRSVTCDLLDSSLPIKRFKGPIAFTDLVSQVLSSLGIPARVINRAGQIENITEIEQVSGAVGQGAFDFLDSYARRVGVVMTTTSDGNIALIRGLGVPIPANLTRLKNNDGNNILSSRMTIDHSTRFARYVARSQISPVASDLDPKDLVSPTGEASDSSIRSTRFLEFETEESSDSAACLLRAEIEANVRRSNSFAYEVVVQGNEVNGVPWDFNTLVQVQDDLSNISDLLLIHSVDTSFDMRSGSSTILTMSFKDAFSFRPQLDAVSAARSQSDDFWLDR